MKLRKFVKYSEIEDTCDVDEEADKQDGEKFTDEDLTTYQADNWPYEQWKLFYFYMKTKFTS